MPSEQFWLAEATQPLDQWTQECPEQAATVSELDTAHLLHVQRCDLDLCLLGPFLHLASGYLPAQTT